MVTKGYRKGVYDRVTEGTLNGNRIGKAARNQWFSVAKGRLVLCGSGTQAGSALIKDQAKIVQGQARAIDVSVKRMIPRRAGRGRRRRTCQTMMLIESILRAGETANEFA
jgi:hypothetical protein